MCKCVLRAVLWSHIGVLMCLLAAEPRSTAGPLFPSQCPYGTILLTVYSMVWDWRVSIAGPILFYWPELLDPFLSLTLFFLSRHSVYMFYCGAGVVTLTGCKSFSPHLTLPTSFNNKYNNNNDDNNNNNEWNHNNLKIIKTSSTIVCTNIELRFQYSTLIDSRNGSLRSVKYWYFM